MKNQYIHIYYKVFIIYFLLIQTVLAIPEAVLVKDINTMFPGIGGGVPDPRSDPFPSSYPSDFINVDGITFFVATDTFEIHHAFPDFDDYSEYVSRRRLWKTDGTEAGTLLVNGFDVTPSSNSLVNINGTLMFIANTHKNGTELWKFDEVLSKTILVKDINPGFGGSNPANFFEMNNMLFFTAEDPLGRSIWQSDGTEKGTKRISNINFGYTSFFSSAEALFFYHENSILKYNGLENEPIRISELDNAKYLATVEDGFFFYYRPSNSSNLELWKSDGTGTDLIKVKAFLPSDKFLSQPTVINKKLVFFTSNGAGTYNLWSSDGTGYGTLLLKGSISITDRDNYVELGGTPSILGKSNKVLFFRIISEDGFELWRTDGTKTSTVLVKNIEQDVENDQFVNLSRINDIFYFRAGDTETGYFQYMLWQTDGTNRGTKLIRSFEYRPVAHYYPFVSLGPIVDINGLLLFSAYVDSIGSELWKIISDNTENQPIAINDAYTLDVNSTLFVTSPGVLANDSDDGSLSAILNTNVSNGSLIFNSNGSFNYTPTSGYSGLDSFTYYNSDGELDSEIATVELIIKRTGTGQIAGDFDSDNDVDKDDLTIMRGQFGQKATNSNDPYDMNKDGVINVLDFRQTISQCTRPSCSIE